MMLEVCSPLLLFFRHDSFLGGLNLCHRHVALVGGDGPVVSERIGDLALAVAEFTEICVQSRTLP